MQKAPTSWSSIAMCSTCFPMASPSTKHSGHWLLSFGEPAVACAGGEAPEDLDALQKAGVPASRLRISAEPAPGVSQDHCALPCRAGRRPQDDAETDEASGVAEAGSEKVRQAKAPPELIPLQATWRSGSTARAR